MISVVDKEKIKVRAKRVRLICENTLEHITCPNSEQKQRKNMLNSKHLKNVHTFKKGGKSSKCSKEYN